MAEADERGARVTGASSSLEGKTKVMEWAGGKPNWTAATFQPASAMDGSLATSWCEGAPGPGVGEWLEVRLDRPIQEVEIAGGFRKLAMPHGELPVDAKKLGLGGWEEELDAWFDQSLRTYKSNGRPSVIELTTQKGEVIERFQLGDRIFDDAYRFRVALAPGLYRLRIAQVYPGTRFADTCIAELQFRDVPVPARASPSGLPAALRPFAGPERCRATSEVKVLPSEVTFLGTSPDSDGTVFGAGILLEARSPAGILLPVLDTLSCIGGRGALTCIADGSDAREDAFGSGDDYPAWQVELKTQTAETPSPPEWIGAFKSVGRKVLYRLALRPDPKRKGAFVVSASHDNAVVENAEYTCASLPR